MQNSFEDIPCVYFSSSADGYIIEANESMCYSLGYSRDELVGRKLESILTLATRIFQQTHFFPLLQLKGHAEEIYITLRSKEGEDVPVLTNAVRKEQDGQVLIHFAGITVTKRKKFEDEIIAAKKAAEKALNENITLKAAQAELQKHAEELDRQIALVNHQNVELKQFSHVATHTLQESLRKLLFSTSQIFKTEDKKEVTVGQKIRRAAEEMSEKLKGLQQYVWLTNDEFKFEEVDIRLEMETARKQLELEIPDVSIMLEAEAIPAIEGNSEQLQVLFKELFLNAIRFRKPGNVANVKIYASTLLLNKFRQLADKYSYAEFVKLQIQDSGIGFDDNYGEQAFDLFRKLHDEKSGQGIGLVGKKIVENHNGSISIESKKDIGT